MTRILLSTVLLLSLSTPVLASDTTKVNLKGLPILTKTLAKVDSSRVIVLKGEVTADKMDKLSTQLRALGKNPLKFAYLEINSPGGSITAGLRFIETMRGLRKNKGLKTRCVIRGAAYSMAAVIAMYCHETFMLPSSDLMFHGASYGVRGNADDVVIRVKHVTRWLRQLEQRLAHQMGLSYLEFMQTRGRELWLTDRDAAKYGFVDGLVESFYHEAKPPKERKLRIFFGNIWKPIVNYLERF